MNYELRKRLPPGPRTGRRWHRTSRVALTLVMTLLGSVSSRGQILPDEPVVVGGGRLVVSGEVNVAIAAEDPGFFNYTDYEQNALRSLRGAVTAAVSLGARASLLGEVRSETGRVFDVTAIFLRLRPWGSRSVDFQVGRIPPTFGAFSRRGYGIDNPLIGYPLAYQYLTSLRPDALPTNADDLLGMRGRGWRPSFPLGDQGVRPGLPLMSARRWDTGAQITVGDRPIKLAASVTNGSLSNPLVGDDNGGKQVAGRLEYQPSAGLLVGVSIARAAYLSRSATDALPLRIDDSFTQRAVGVDLEYSRDHWLVRMEGLFSQWRLPRVTMPFIDSPLRAAGWLVETRYRVRPGLYVAARSDYLGFSEIRGRVSGGQSVPWDYPVRRVEVGGGYNVRRNIVAKLAYQHNWRENPFGLRTRFVAGQIVYWF